MVREVGVGNVEAPTSPPSPIRMRGERADLEVVLRVPVGVEDDDSVGCGQVDPQPPRARGEQEAEVLAPRRVEVVHGLVPQVGARAAVQALELVPLARQVVRQNVQHAHHLEDHQRNSRRGHHSMAHHPPSLLHSCAPPWAIAHTSTAQGPDHVLKHCPLRNATPSGMQPSTGASMQRPTPQAGGLARSCEKVSMVGGLVEGTSQGTSQGITGWARTWEKMSTR